MIVSAALAILVLTVALSAIGLWLAPGLIERCVFRPYKVARGSDLHTIITSGFVHADLPHLLFNMITFWFFAFALEGRIGSTGFLLLYFAALAASSLRTFLKHRDEPGYGSLGASGAISAVLFASIVYFPTQQLYILPLPVPIPAPLFAVAYVGWSWWSGRHSRGRINHDAHLDGALAGLLFVALVDPGAYRQLWQAVS